MDFPRIFGVGLALSLWLAGCAGSRDPRASEAVAEGERATELARADHAAELFAAHCAVCHGARGGGDGPAHPWLFPHARDFTSGRFRLVSTADGAPSEDDLVRTLERGVPGSAMPAFAWMPQRDLRDLARHVRALAELGLAGRLRAEARAEGEGHRMRAATRAARAALEPGRALPTLGVLPDNPAVLARGRELYVRDCAGCHGTDGAGDSKPRLNQDGTLNWPRDFTAGFLKGGATPAELAWRVQTGLPGTAMPAFDYEPGDLEAVVAHVRQMIPPGSHERLVHRRRTLKARRVEALPLEPTDPAWERATFTEVVLAPLRWNRRAVLGAELAVCHDGERLAVAVRWNDPTGDPMAFSEASSPDGVALQLSRADNPPLFGMGSSGHPTVLWHWQALEPSQLAGALDLFERPPHVVGEPFAGASRPDVPLYDRAAVTPEPSTRAGELEARGVGQPTRELGDGRLSAAPRWYDGRWTVILAGDLDPGNDVEPGFAAGEQLQVAVAVWNGAAGDRGGQKSISIWHRLALE